MSRPLDVIVFGASSFVGQILVRHLWERHGADGELRWALAGRSESRLRAVRDSLGERAASLPLLVADSSDAAALHRLCEQTRVIVSTVGPYALYGSTLVAACADTGTDYCDLTGEVQWMRRMISAHEATAQRTGARIVHACGFDSIPSDLGMRFLQEAAIARFGQPLRQVSMRVRLTGGVSGGTVASMVNFFQELADNPALARDIRNPHLLAGISGGARQTEVLRPTRDAFSDNWLAPFIMAAINTRVVHRSNALSGWRWGQDLAYDEAWATGSGVRGLAMATAFTAALGGFVAGAAIGPVRRLLSRHVLPKPGEGPSPEEQRNGRFELTFHGRDDAGHRLTARVTGERDPGYGATARMLGEAAACLAQDMAGRPGGFWTPASLLGDALQQRLQAHAGMRFQLLD